METGKHSPDQLRDHRLCSLGEYLQDMPYRIHPSYLAPQERYTLRVLKDEEAPDQAAIDIETIIISNDFQPELGFFHVQFLMKIKDEIVEKELVFSPKGLAVIGNLSALKEIGCFPGGSDLSDWNRELWQLLDTSGALESTH